MLFSSILLSLTLGVIPDAGRGGYFHSPHDIVNAVAAVPVQGGSLELFAAVSVDTSYFTVMHSTDMGLTWELLRGTGLESANAIDVVYHPEMPADQGKGLVVIGTDRGLWAYHPQTQRLHPLNYGLPADDQFVLDLAAPLQGSEGPLVMITVKGRIYAWGPQDKEWQERLNSGFPGTIGRGQVAINPHFDPQAENGPHKAMMASLDGRFLTSTDGGVNWTLHSQFNPTNQWFISGIAFSEDYSTSGNFVLVRGKAQPEKGEIWQSSNFGETFQNVATYDTQILAVASTPPDPFGNRYFYASGRLYPWEPPYEMGILRSDDGGLTWNDQGSAQDFVTRPGRNVDPNELEESKEKRHLFVSPNFSQDSRVWASRIEGMWLSEDAGINWRHQRLRMESDIRRLVIGKRPSGEILLYGATYGSSTVQYNFTTQQTIVLAEHNPLVFQKGLAISPNYEKDGTVLVGGSQDFGIYYDQSIPPANPYQAHGWLFPPLDHASTPSINYPRVITISPNFDGTGAPGSDSTFFFNALFEPPYMSNDGGLTGDPLSEISGGGVVERLLTMQIAPTYLPDSPQTRQDVYGTPAVGKQLYRLELDQWKPIYDFQSAPTAMKVDPNYARPSNPRVFAAMRDYPYVVSLRDYPGGVRQTILPWGLEGLAVTDITTTPNFSNEPILYVSTLSSGIYKLDLRRFPRIWQPVGKDYPKVYTKSVVVSPDYATDRLVFAGTKEGLLYRRDVSDEPWQQFQQVFFRDNQLEALRTYSPNDPLNTQPLRPWAWEVVPRGDFTGIAAIRGPNILEANHDGSYFETEELAKSLRFFTLTGPNMGFMTITVTHYETGSPVIVEAVDLATLPGVPIANHTIDVQLPKVTPVHIRVDITLNHPNKSVYFDGLEVVR